MKHTHIHVHGDLAQVFATQDVQTHDDWAKWNAEHKERGLKHKAIADNKLVGKAQTELHAKAAEAHMKAHKAIEIEDTNTATKHAKEAAKHEAELKEKHGYLPKPIEHKRSDGAGGAPDSPATLRRIAEYNKKHPKTGPHIPGKHESIIVKRTRDLDSYKRDQAGKFATSSGTGEQHAATAELHTSLAARKGTDHPHHALHTAAAAAHQEAAKFLQQANKAQHPGAAIAAEEAAKKARVHENLINKGRGSKPDGEVDRQNKAMSDPRTMAENKERKAEFDKKHEKGSKKKTKDAAPCGCGGHTDDAATADVLFTDASGWEESKHSRDHGKFSTMGHAGGGVDHHITRQEYHEKQQSASQFGDKRQAHAMAAQHHQKAAHHLATAYSHHALGDKEGADKQHMLAQHHANQASRHEGTSGFPSPLKPDLKSHPNYSEEDHDYLKGKGWSDTEIGNRWDEERAAGHGPQKGNKHNASLFGAGK